METLQTSRLETMLSTLLEKLEQIDNTVQELQIKCYQMEARFDQLEDNFATCKNIMKLHHENLETLRLEQAVNIKQLSQVGSKIEYLTNRHETSVLMIATMSQKWADMDSIIRYFKAKA
jgi:hypothetical protein